jgi:hypothetical protein
VKAQSCPVNKTDSITAYPNTFFPASQALVNAGANSITLGAATYGSTPISSGDVLLIIQMQGAQITSTNSGSYGNGSSGSGYLSNSNMVAGNMEYVLAANSVPLGGGTLNTVSGLAHTYKNTPFGTDGQYTYQIVRVPVYYNLKLTGSLTAPRWDGTSGGVIVLYATSTLNLNGKTIDASGLGFRGGGGITYSGSGGGSSNDFVTLASANANGGKGEGIAGTPKYLNNNNAFLDVSALEGYPNGSYGKGAPGNAGGGGTDGNPVNNNNENTGGGGGGNGGIGGIGGNAWNSNIASGGKPGAVFAAATPTRRVLGGGGGAGTTNNGTGTPGNGFASSGAAGGGIIILMANAITGTGSIKANGAAGNSTVKNDGSGGGGAGGSVLIYSKTGNLSNVIVTAKGGIGGINQTGTIDPHGPGGGGGGGVVYSNMTLSASSSVNGGAAGTTNKFTSNYGATAGAAGFIVQTITQSQTPTFPIACVVLSVNFLDLAAEQTNGLATIRWNVAGETDTREYLVEKSTDGVNFSVIGHTPYTSGSASTNNYEYPDNNAFANSGVVYYRIKELENSGRYQYSKIVSLRADASTGTFSVYPNPARTTAAVSFVSAARTEVSLRLFDLKGGIVWQQQYQANKGQNIIQLNNIGAFPNGMYILQWSDGSRTGQAKLVVNH